MNRLRTYFHRDKITRPLKKRSKQSYNGLVVRNSFHYIPALKFIKLTSRYPPFSRGILFPLSVMSNYLSLRHPQPRLKWSLMNLPRQQTSNRIGKYPCQILSL